MLWMQIIYFHSYPNKDMNTIHRILKPDGFFMLEIPNLKFRLLKNTGLLAQLIYGKKSRLNAGVHLFYYDLSSLDILMVKHGLMRVNTYVEQSPMYGNKLMRVLNKLYYLLTKSIYHLTNKKFNLAPKLIVVYKKIHIEANNK